MDWLVRYDARIICSERIMYLRHPDSPTRLSLILRDVDNSEMALYSLDSRDDDDISRIPIACDFSCLLYTSDAADEGLGVDLGGRRIIKKKKRGEGWREGVGGGARRQSGSERLFCFFFQAEDGIRDLVRSRGLGDVYKRQDFGYGLASEV